MAVPADLEQIFEIKLTEVMSIGCPSRDGALEVDAADAIAAAAERAAAPWSGPGSAVTTGLAGSSASLLGGSRLLVIDADGLNAIAGGSSRSPIGPPRRC